MCRFFCHKIRVGKYPLPHGTDTNSALSSFVLQVSNRNDFGGRRIGRRTKDRTKYLRKQHNRNLIKLSYKQLQKVVEEVTGFEFNSCNISYYGCGSAFIPPHNDDEYLFWLNKNDDFVIASVSIMCEREFRLTHMETNLQFSIDADHYILF